MNVWLKSDDVEQFYQFNTRTRFYAVWIDFIN